MYKGGKYKEGKTFFRGSDGDFYDGNRAYHDGIEQMIPRVVRYEKKSTIFDIMLTEDFDIYYDTLIGMGYKDVSIDGVSLDTPDESFSYIVSVRGVVYSIVIKVEPYNWIHIHNSDLLFEKVNKGRDFLLSYRRLKDEGIRCNTLSIAAGELYRKEIGSDFSMIYPDCYRTKIKEDETAYDFLYSGYRGGWNFLKGDEGKEVKEGYVYDVNSLYPYIFAYYPMPSGSPEYREGTPSKTVAKLANAGKVFLMARIEVDAYVVKDGYLPFIMSGPHGGVDTDGSGILVLTWEELKLLKNHYRVSGVKYIDYLYFFTTKGVGKDFVRRHYQEKKSTTDPVQRRISKGILNYLIGGFSKKMVRMNLVKDSDGDWRVKKTESPGFSQMYIGCAVTSYARCKIVQDAQKNYDNFVYSDTDSLHLTKPAVGISIGDGIGQYKIEAEYTEGKYMKRKWYGYKTKDSIKIVTAGIPKDVTEKIQEKFFDHSVYDIMEDIYLYAEMALDEA